MSSQYKTLISGLLLFSSLSSFAEPLKEIAITIDDVPFVGSARDSDRSLHINERLIRILQTLVDNDVPATAFVITGSMRKNQWQILETYRQKGLTIANHTETHLNLNKVATSRYLNDLDSADQKLSPYMTETKYFRYPYLAYGQGEKKQAIREYLANHQYVIAPVTIDSRDFKFNVELTSHRIDNRLSYFKSLKPRYLNYIWKETQQAERFARGQPKRQILLIHANLLNSYALNDIIQMYKENGYRFITLDEALSPVMPSTASSIPHVNFHRFVF